MITGLFVVALIKYTLLVQISRPSCENLTPEHVKLGTDILSNSFDSCTLHTLTSFLLAVAKTSE